MMVAIGNFFFHYRNTIAPVFFIVLFIPAAGMFGSYSTAASLGLALALTGQAIRVATIGLVYIIRGGSKKRIFAKGLVTTGIFGHCRNPLYMGNILIMTGLFIMADTVLALIAVPVVIFFYQAIVMAEEEYLRVQYPEEYTEFERKSNRWIPRLKGLGETFRSMTFNWRRVILKEYNTTFIWMLGAVIVFMQNIHGIDKALFSRLLPAAITAGVFLLVMYLGVMYLKKTKRLRD
ncbi:isoprenylcysteine carboxylmethyltransferase family protein [bacterium]|nr:isoprenylcysteine carboxylmethyltransferase family protein [bacterium]